jgi:pimeloyl-ACP methyl ester carboxylesterase
MSQLSDNSSDLVVLLHAYTKSAGDLDWVRRQIAKQGPYRGADVIAPTLPFGLLSMARPEDVLVDVLAQIDNAWTKRSDAGKPYRRILLVGHSMGALFLRKLYVIACGENTQAPFEKRLKALLLQRNLQGVDKPRQWAGEVDRIILLAGMNRGWTISHHMSLLRALTMKIGVAAGQVLSWVRGRPPIIFSIRRGAPFITQLRLQWLAMRQARGDKGVGDALTVQLLGTIDDLVAPEDNIDLVTGREFVYLDVPASGHENIVQMDDTDAGRARVAVLQAAVSASPEQLERQQVLPADSIFQPEPDITDVVFVIHGIRDQGYWTHKIARRVIAQGRDKRRRVRSVTSSYGYFPMLSFLRPGARQQKVEWLMDQYTEARARYPRATFTYVGHSHGTYLAAKALHDYPAARFQRIVFAGSVVNRDYHWHDFIPSQTDGVLNFVASADWVVAFFPNAFQRLQIQDLGSAGHDGFSEARRLPELIEPTRSAGGAGEGTGGPVTARFLVGGHGAALQEKLWDAIAGYVLGDDMVVPRDVEMAHRHPWWIDYPARVAPLIWAVLGTILIWLLYQIIGLPIAEWLKTVVVIGYAALVWLVLTRV